jgi:hypothetical protein
MKKTNLRIEIAIGRIFRIAIALSLAAAAGYFVMVTRVMAVELPDTWRTGNIDQIADLIGQKYDEEYAPAANKEDAATRDAFWNAVTAVVWERFLSHSEHFADYPKSSTLSVIHSVAARLEPAQKASVLASLLHCYVEKPDVLRTLSPSDFYNLCRSLVKLNAEETVSNEVTIQWAQANSNKLGDCQPKTLALLVPALESDSDSTELMQSVVQLIWAKYLSKPDFLASAKFDAIRLCSTTAAHLSPDQKQQIRSLLTFSCLYSPQVVAHFDGQSVDALCTILKTYNFTDFEICSFIVRWHEKSANWKMADAVALSRLVSQLKYGHVDGSDATTTDFCTQIYAGSLMQPTFLREVNSNDLAWIIRDAGICFTPDQKQSLATALYKFLFVEHGRGSEPALLDIASVGKIMEHANQNTEGTSFPEYTQAVIAALNRGDYMGDHLYWDPKFASMGLCSPGARQKMIPEIKDSSGMVRLDVIRVLGFAYQLAGQVQDWEKYLDESIAGSQGDERAALLLGRGYAAEIETADWGPLNGEKWVQDAIKAASTDEMRVTCAIWWSQRLCYKYKYQPDITFLRGQLVLVSKESAQRSLNHELLRVEHLQRRPYRGRHDKAWEVEQLKERMDELEKWIISQKAAGQPEEDLQLAVLADQAMKKRIEDSSVN